MHQLRWWDAKVSNLAEPLGHPGYSRGLLLRDLPSQNLAGELGFEPEDYDAQNVVCYRYTIPLLHQLWQGHTESNRVLDGQNVVR